MATPTNENFWSFTQSGVSTAVHTYTLVTQDAAGNKGTGSDTLYVRTAGHDHIVGGSGANLIYGGAGADTLTGGSGTNTFIYGAVTDAPVATRGSTALDTITNWVSGQDHIDLTALGHMTFGGNTSTVNPDTVEWYVSGGNTYICRRRPRETRSGLRDRTRRRPRAVELGLPAALAGSNRRAPSDALQ